MTQISISLGSDTSQAAPPGACRSIHWDAYFS